MKATLDSDAIRVARGVSKDSGRPVIECVKVGDGAIVAADGFMLVRKEIETEGTGTVLINGKKLKQLTDALGSKKLVISSEKGHDIQVQGVKSEIPFERPEELTSDVITTQGVDGTYPNYEQLFPVSEPKALIGFSLGVLRRLLNTLGHNTDIIKFRIRGPEEPVEFLAGEDFNGLIMPAQLLESGENNEPDRRWHPTKKQILRRLKGEYDA